MSEIKITKISEQEFTTESVFFVSVQELAPHQNLFELQVNNEPMQSNLAQYCFHELVLGLKLLHGNNIAHRDLNPHNMVLDQDFRVKLIDFDQAAIQTKEQQKFKTKCGSVEFMAIEMRFNREVEYDAFKADIFSLGVCLLYFLTGHRISDVRVLQFVFEEKWGEFWEFLKP